MGLHLSLARKALFFLGGAFTLSKPAWAAVYDPKSWFLSSSVSYDVVNPSKLNKNSATIAPIQGLAAGRLKLEKGLSAPSWAHWAEFGFHTGSAGGGEEQNGVRQNYSQKLTHLSFLPLGVTYWFDRTSTIDFGATLGAGVGIAPSNSLSRTAGTGADTVLISEASGGVSPIVDARLEGRFWLGRNLALGVAGGVRYYSPTLVSSAGTESRAELFNLTVLAGLTYSFGEVKSGPRTHVEVIAAEERPKEDPKAIVPSKAVTPVKSAGPKKSRVKKLPAQ